MSDPQLAALIKRVIDAAASARDDRGVWRQRRTALQALITSGVPADVAGVTVLAAYDFGVSLRAAHIAAVGSITGHE